VVREADAHAWIEVHLAGRGWVEADPTPAAAYEAAHGSIGGRSLEALGAWLGGWAAELQGYLRAGDARAALRRLRA